MMRAYFLGSRPLVHLSNKVCYSAGCEWQEAEQIAKSHANAVFQVAGPSAIVLEAYPSRHMTVYSSSIPGAGFGLFGRCQPPQRVWEEGQAASPNVVIRRHDQVCLYTKHPLAVPLEQLPTVDYVLSAEVRGQERLYDSANDGSNIGRFANDAGLLPGLKAMVRLSNKLCYPAGCDWQEVEQIAKSHANAVFQGAGPSAVILVATKDIVLGQQSQEIFISYGIQGYWLPYIASKVSQWGLANEMVQAVMWCATSEQRNWPPNLRQQCLDDMQRVQPGIDCYVPCPWPELLGGNVVCYV